PALNIAGNNVSGSGISARPETRRATLASVAEARAAMLSGFVSLGGEAVPLGEALGRVLARPVIATRPQPPFPVSEMDGYAMRATDTPGRLKLVGESAAG